MKIVEDTRNGRAYAISTDWHFPLKRGTAAAEAFTETFSHFLYAIGMLEQSYMQHYTVYLQYFSIAHKLLVFVTHEVYTLFAESYGVGLYSIVASNE